MNIFHSCRKVDELLSQSLDEPLGFIDRTKLRMHLSMCGNCRNVQQQLEVMHALGPDIGTFDDDDDLAPATPSTHAPK